MIHIPFSALLAGLALGGPGSPPSGDDLLSAIPPASSTTMLSDERTLTRWAHPKLLAEVHSAPDGNSKTITRLRSFTEMGRREVYVALISRRAANGRVWVRIRLPRRGRDVGWVPRAALGPWHRVTTSLRIDRKRLRATLLRDGRRVWEAKVGIGDRASPTPAGTYFVREKISNSGGNPAYGPWAFGTSAYSSLSDWPGGGVVGIHGTDEPGLIPGRPSHGCVRLNNTKVTQLAGKLPIGTPVVVS